VIRPINADAVIVAARISRPMGHVRHGRRSRLKMAASVLRTALACARIFGSNANLHRGTVTMSGVSFSFSGSGNLESIREDLSEAIIRDVPQDDSDQSAALAAGGQRVAYVVDTLIGESGLTDGYVSASGRYHDDGAFVLTLSLSAVPTPITPPPPPPRA
jgi:hypothetical protein